MEHVEWIIPQVTWGEEPPRAILDAERRVLDRALSEIRKCNHHIVATLQILTGHITLDSFQKLNGLVKPLLDYEGALVNVKFSPPLIVIPKRLLRFGPHEFSSDAGDQVEV